MLTFNKLQCVWVCVCDCVSNFFSFHSNIPVSKVSATGTCKHRAVEASQMPPDLEKYRRNCREGLFLRTRSGKSSKEAPLVEGHNDQRAVVVYFGGLLETCRQGNPQLLSDWKNFLRCYFSDGIYKGRPTASDKNGRYFPKNCCMAVQSPETCCCWSYTFLQTTDAFNFVFVTRDCIDIFIQYMLLLYHAHIACLRYDFHVQTRS